MPAASRKDTTCTGLQAPRYPTRPVTPKGGGPSRIRNAAAGGGERTNRPRLPREPELAPRLRRVTDERGNEPKCQTETLPKEDQSGWLSPLAEQIRETSDRSRPLREPIHIFAAAVEE